MKAVGFIIAIAIALLVGYLIGKGSIPSQTYTEESVAPLPTDLAEPQQVPAQMADPTLQYYERELVSCRRALSVCESELTVELDFRDAFEPDRLMEQAEQTERPAHPLVAAQPDPEVEPIPAPSYDLQRYQPLLDQPAAGIDNFDELHQQFVSEPRNESWATEVEQQLNDFIILHADAKALNIDAVECRTRFCVVVGEQVPGSPAWSQLIVDMRMSEWWPFQAVSARALVLDQDTELNMTLLQRINAE